MGMHVAFLMERVTLLHYLLHMFMLRWSIKASGYYSFAIFPIQIPDYFLASIFGALYTNMENSLLQQLNETTAFIKTKYTKQPLIGIVLGSGLGNFTKGMEIECEIDYSDLPHFPVSTVLGHKGRLVFGTMNNKPVVVMAGRFHFYEGYTPQQVVYPIRVMKMLGVETLLLSNAAGGVNPGFTVGDMMIITDHISMFTVSPLLGKNEDALGTRFPDMSEAYNKEIIGKARALATQLGYMVKEGVYCGVTGPTFENPCRI
jgi:purine-nucleoside phosphorylase